MRGNGNAVRDVLLLAFAAGFLIAPLGCGESAPSEPAGPDTSAAPADTSGDPPAPALAVRLTAPEDLAIDVPVTPRFTWGIRNGASDTVRFALTVGAGVDGRSHRVTFHDLRDTSFTMPLALDHDAWHAWSVTVTDSLGAPLAESAQFLFRTTRSR